MPVPVRDSVDTCASLYWGPNQIIWQVVKEKQATWRTYLTVDNDEDKDSNKDTLIVLEIILHPVSMLRRIQR